MGCTSSNQAGISKETTNAAPATVTHDGQQLIPEHFRKWLKTNRPKADEYVLHDVLSTAPPSNEVEDYRNIVGKALDLLAERQDIKSTTKLGKLLQKEINLASPRKVAHTIQILQQTAEKLRDGQLKLENEASPVTAAETERKSNVTAAESKPAPLRAGEPGIGLRDALEKARVLFYKVNRLNPIEALIFFFLNSQGKQAAIFANPNGGYDVRIIDENDDTIHHDGNLLRSIVVTEVKMRPKAISPSRPTTSSTPLFIPPPPPTTAPPAHLLDENEITDDFRRSIDAALKGLEVVYQTSAPPRGSERSQEIHVDRTTTTTRTSSPPPPKVIQYGVTNAPLPKSISKEQTALAAEAGNSHDSTINLAEIIRQMAEQQKIVSERLSRDTKEETEPLLIQALGTQSKLVDNTNDLTLDSVEVTTRSDIATKEASPAEIERIVREIKEHGEKFESKESLPNIVGAVKQPSSYSLGLTSPLSNESIATLSSSSTSQSKSKLRSENRPKSFIATDDRSGKDRFNLNKQMSLDELAQLTQTGLSNPHLPSSTTKLGISTSSGKIDEEERLPLVSAEPLTKMATSISQIIEEHQPIFDEPSFSSPAAPAPAVTPVQTQPTVKSPSHNVTYTEIIHSESRDGEQSRRFITESYNDHPSNEDEQTTTLKVVTKSEFSNHPTSGEKIMEQSVQVITVKVRNETIKTTIQQASLPSSSTDNDGAYERRPVSELVKNFEVVAGSGTASGVSGNLST